jgi:hypothetical protein
VSKGGLKIRKKKENIKAREEEKKQNWRYLVKGTNKGKAIPLQAWTGPESSRRLRIPDFKTVGS